MCIKEVCTFPHLFQFIHASLDWFQGFHSGEQIEKHTLLRVFFARNNAVVLKTQI